MKKNLRTHLLLSRSVYTGIFFALLFFIPLTTQASEWNYRAQSKIQWRDYGAAAFAEAKSTGKPLYILVYADGCHWCRKYETETLETKLIRRVLKNK